MSWFKFKEKMQNLEFDGWLTHKEIATRIGEPDHSTYCGLSLLSDDGLIEIDKSGKPFKYKKTIVIKDIPVVHGTTCHKVDHVGTGYLHDEKDDTSYDVDGCVYCGRCHAAI